MGSSGARERTDHQHAECRRRGDPRAPRLGDEDATEQHRHAGDHPPPSSPEADDTERGGDAEHSVAFRLATSLPDPLDRLLSVGRRRWSRRVAPYPARAVSLLVALVATLQLVQLLRTTAVVTRGVALWLGLLALSTVGLAVRVDGHALRETATGRFVTAVLVLPREPGDD